MNKIKNIKTSKSLAQKKDFLTSLKARKRFFLQSTDWTQLQDVKIENFREVSEWRKKLREFDIGNNPGEDTSRRLDEIIDQQPEIHARSLDPVQEETEPELEPKDDVEYLEPRDGVSVARELFNNYKSNELLKSGMVEYNLKKVLLEEAVDKKLSKSKVDTPLLDQDSHNHSIEDLDNIIEECREYFKQINKLYTDLNKEERSLYNMSTDELNEWFEKNGHRYRCKN